MNRLGSGITLTLTSQQQDGKAHPGTESLEECLPVLVNMGLTYQLAFVLF